MSHSFFKMVRGAGLAKPSIKALTRDDIMKRVAEFCNDDETAVSLISDIWHFCDVLADIMDDTKDVAPETISAVIVWGIFDLPRNKLYQSIPFLHPLFRVCLSNWFAAGTLAKSDDPNDKATAYTLRSSRYDFFVGVILASAGQQNADLAALYFRSLPSPESFSDFIDGTSG